jgi:phage replication initiation protein
MPERLDIRLTDDGLAILSPRLPAKGQSTIIDTLRFSTNEIAFDGYESCVTPDEMASKVIAWLRPILGFSEAHALDKGRDFFLFSYVLGDIKAPLGHFSFGGSRQKGAVSIYLTGQGCTHAQEGWEKRLHDAITDHQVLGVSAHITRIDIAYDDTTGLLNPRDCVPLLKSGGFDRFGNRPHVQQFGDWLESDPRDKGLTFNLGTRHGSQLLRVYEKDKQLKTQYAQAFERIGGSLNMPACWNRVEVQFSRHARILPLDMLLDPTAYFLAAYPCFERLFSDEIKAGLKHTEKKQLVATVTIGHVVHYARQQAGRAINLLFGLGMSATEIADTLREQMGRLPSRIDAITPTLNATPGSVGWSPTEHSKSDHKEIQPWQPCKQM